MSSSEVQEPRAKRDRREQETRFERLFVHLRDAYAAARERNVGLDERLPWNGVERAAWFNPSLAFVAFMNFVEPPEAVLGALAALIATRAGYVVLPPPQASPVSNERRSVWAAVVEDAGTFVNASVRELIVDDMRTRDAVGRERYGYPLQAFNGRDALRDVYEESLDQAVYLRQVFEETFPRSAYVSTQTVESWLYAADEWLQSGKVIGSSDALWRVAVLRAYRDALSAVEYTRELLERRAEGVRRKALDELGDAMQAERSE